MSQNYLLLSYVLVWLAYLFSCFITPARSAYEDTHERAILLVGTYVILSAAGAFVLMIIFRRRSGNGAADRIRLLYDYLKPRRLVILTSCLVVGGLLLHLYDKIFIMNIDYSVGIAKARYAWIENGAARGGGVSSWQSVAGHILVNFYFIPIAMVLLFWKELPRRHRYLGYGVSVAAVLIYSASMGSRSVPLFFLLYVVSLLLLVKSVGGKFLPKGFSWLFVLLVGLIFVYNIFVFHERGVVSGGDDPKQYTRSFFSQLGGEETGGFKLGEKLPGFLGEMFYYGVLTIMYVNHNQWTFDYVLTLDERPGQSMFNTVYGGLAKIGIIKREQVQERAFSGVFLSLPGCAYYDFGLWGMVIIAALHGIFLFAADYLVCGSRLRTWRLFLFLVVSMFSLVSPLTSAVNLMTFPYLIICYLSLPFLVALVRLSPIKPAKTFTTAG